MNKSEQDLRQQLKSEADEILFENLHFDSRLKEQVIRSITAEEERIGIRKWFTHGRKKWLYGPVAAVTIVGLLFVSSPEIQNMFVPSVKEDVNNPSTFHSGNQEEGPNTTMMGEIPGSLPIKTWSLQTAEEAKKVFGDGLFLPSYTPEQFTLNEIFASGVQMETATKIVFSYVSDELSFIVIEDKENVQNEFHHFKTININGINGFLKSTESDERGNALTEDSELHWFAGGVHYTIAGNISEKEVIKVAESTDE